MSNSVKDRSGVSPAPAPGMETSLDGLAVPREAESIGPRTADSTLREAADHMVRESVGRLVVIGREGTPVPLGAHGGRLRALDQAERGFRREA